MREEIIALFGNLFTADTRVKHERQNFRPFYGGFAFSSIHSYLILTKGMTSIPVFKKMA